VQTSFHEVFMNKINYVTAAAICCVVVISGGFRVGGARGKTKKGAL